ncbi:hypothetical protein SVA_3021 [Sulfurifustis variabilis]|uniref:Uncharacterized protein n=1 Tax=Sulfurifustis variabilis TaxID=1675686 RepID=A0A1B4V7S1_9GAMM|nr:hypothetical protein [Sulfurifustis variabilis]BAU49569.1 hypothetical protein SVA_3021 [Sulfurifustis variabilis]
MRSELFWNEPYRFVSTRPIDPLGFDALREAMANVLAPFLTGATRHAEHYVAVVVGLRWAKSRATRSIDRDIWPLFAAFERGLKQYWHRHPGNRSARRRYLGKRRIADICNGKRPDIQAPILQDQRGVGLLGNYVESVRAIGLVRPGELVIGEKAVTQLLGDPRFEWDGASPGSWQKLDYIFSSVDVRSAWPKLGRRLFDKGEASEGRIRMYSSAQAVRRHPTLDWLRLAGGRELLEPQRRIAAATGATAELEERLRGLFSDLLAGLVPRLADATVRRLANMGRQLVKLEVIDTVWPGQPVLAKAIRAQIERVASGRLSAETLLDWHHEIMGARGTERWLQELGERSALQLPKERGDPDFRLTNLRTLLQETRWAG